MDTAETRQLHSDMIAHRMALVSIGREMSKLEICPLCKDYDNADFLHDENCPIGRAVHQYELWQRRQPTAV